MIIAIEFIKFYIVESVKEFYINYNIIIYFSNYWEKFLFIERLFSVFLEIYVMREN